MQCQNARTAFDANAANGPLIPVCEILGSFSYALDLTEGQPPGHSLCAAFDGDLVAVLRDAVEAGTIRPSNQV